MLRDSLILTALSVGVLVGCGGPVDGEVETADDVKPRRVRDLEDQVNRLKAEASVREMTLKSLRRRADLLAQQVHELRLENRRQLDHIKALGGTITERDKLRKRVARLTEQIETLQSKLQGLSKRDPNSR
ncbi:MAG: hypothetical protein ACOCWV_00340 [Planctomycetota bacterium]